MKQHCKSHIIKFISLIVLAVFFVSGCVEDKKSGKITVTLLDQAKGEIKFAEVLIEGVGVSSYPYVFSGLKPYKTYTIYVNKLNDNYLEAQKISVEATKLGSEVVINIGSAPYIVLDSEERIYESEENNGVLSNKIIKGHIENCMAGSMLTSGGIFVEGLPDGITYDVKINTYNSFEIVLKGKALSHEKRDSASGIKIVVLSKVIEGAKRNLISKGISVEFKDLPVMKEITPVKNIDAIPLQETNKVIAVETPVIESKLPTVPPVVKVIPSGLAYFTEIEAVTIISSPAYIIDSKQKFPDESLYLPFITK